MTFDFSPLTAACESFGLPLDGDALDRFTVFGDMLAAANEKMNLTAITDPDGIVIKHFLDSVMFFKNINVLPGDRLIDVGTGAGFPGLALKIARPDVKVTLLDSQKKRLDFLSEVLRETGLEAQIVNCRAEDGARTKELREQFDFAAARAVAALPVLCELTIPYVKPGGYFVAMKGPDAVSEVKAAENAYKTLGCEPPRVFRETLTGSETRCFVAAKKISQTSTKYPRNFSKIKKSAL